MRVALDATTSLGENISGVGIYSRELLNGLAASGTGDEWDWFYRSQRYWRALRMPRRPGVTRRLLADSFGNRSAGLFHGLNQRLPKKTVSPADCYLSRFVCSDGGDYSTPEFRDRFAIQAREAAESADLIVAVSEFTSQQVESLLRVPRARIRVIHHGVVRRPIPELPREKVVLCVGAIQKRKNQAALIRAFRGMPPDWKLVLAGSEGYEAGEILRDLPANVLVTGYLAENEISRWYARASIFAFPSFDEGFGMPVLEAMAAGIPVIAGNRSALPEVCGDAAILVKPDDSEQIADALLRLKDDSNYSRELVSRGLTRAAGFTWDKSVSRTLQVYRELDFS